MIWKPRWLVALLAWPWLVVPGQALTLDEAIQLGLGRNETVLIAQQEVEKAKGQSYTALSEALPKLSLNGFYTRNWEIPSTVINGNLLRFGSANVVNGNATFTIPLYKGGKALAARRGARALRTYSDAGLREVRQQVAFDIQRAFYGVLLAEELVGVSESALHQAEAHLEQVAQLHRVGTASEYDLLRAQVQVADLRPAAIAARNNRDMALLTLKDLIGMGMNAPVDVEGSLADAAAGRAPPVSDIEAAVQLALKSRPDLRAMDARIDLLECAVRIQAAELRPSLSLVSSYQNQAQVNKLQSLEADQFIQSYNSRFVLDIPVFDGMKSRGEVKRARADLAEARYSRQQFVEGVELEARQAFMRVQEAGERLRAQQETVAQARKGLAIAEVRYSTGVGTQLEALDAQQTLTQTQTNYARGLNDYLVSVAGLEKAIGTVK